MRAAWNSPRTIGKAKTDDGWDIFVSAVNSSGTEGSLSDPALGDVLAVAA